MLAREVFMRTRIATLVFLGLLLSGLATANDKKKVILPDYVLQAQTVAVVVDPDAPVSETNPNDSKKAADNVERAFMTWGRYRPVIDVRSADLVIVIRKGRAPGPVIEGGSNANDRPVVIQQPTDSQVRVAGQWGPPPPLSQRQQQQQQRTAPRLGTEAGSPDDLFEVYRGQTKYPLDRTPVWLYMGKDALNAPDVAAVEEFKKAVTEAEKAKN
jgi:hypothetical protein